MIKRFFDYEDGDFCRSLSDKLAVDSDGDFLIKLSDNMAMDLDTGDVHLISNWSDTNEDD